MDLSNQIDTALDQTGSRVPPQLAPNVGPISGYGSPVNMMAFDTPSATSTVKRHSYANERTWSDADVLHQARPRVLRENVNRAHVSFGVPTGSSAPFHHTIWLPNDCPGQFPTLCATDTPAPSLSRYTNPFLSDLNASSDVDYRHNRPVLKNDYAIRANPPTVPSIVYNPQIAERRKTIKIDKFDGSSCVETFLLKFQHASHYNGWQDRDKAAHLAAALTGSAGLILWNLADPTFDELVARLRQRYGSKEQHEKFRHELRARRRKRDENLQELAQDIERLAALAYPDDPQATRDRFGIEAFIEAIGDPELICKIREREPPTIQCALSVAMKLEILHRARDSAMNKSARPVYNTYTNEGSDAEIGNGNRQLNPRRNEPRTKSGRKEAVDVVQTVDNPLVNDLKRQLNEALQRREVAECESQRLKQEVESLRTCAPPLTGQPQAPISYPINNRPTAASAGNSSTDAQLYPKRSSNSQCYTCGSYGHLRRECPVRNLNSSITMPASYQTYQARCSKRSDADNEGRVYLSVTVDGQTYACLLDTGCEVSVIPSSMAKNYMLRDRES